MKPFFAFIFLIQLIHSFGISHGAGANRCVNMWDEGCINGQLPGSGKDDYYVNGGFNPGKRCINMWDEGCINGQLPGSGLDNDYVNGGFNPGKRCLDTLGGCNTGRLGNSGGTTDRLDRFANGRKLSNDLLARMYNTHH